MPIIEAYTITQLLKSSFCPVGRTRLMELIRNGVKFQKGELEEGRNYIIAWRSSEGKKASWIIDREEFENFKERARKVK